MLRHATYLLLLLLLLLLAACGSKQTNLALGTLERDRIALTATANEIIIELPVAAGKQVTKGTILVKLDDRQQLAHVAKAEAEVAQGEATLEKLRNGARKEEVAVAKAKVSSAKAQLKEAKLNYRRIKELAETNLNSQSKVDQALAARDSAKANLEIAREQLRLLTNGARPEDLAYAQAKLTALQATLTSEQKKLADLTVTATRDGLLDNLPWNQGERVTIGSPIAVVLAGKSPFARIYVPERYRVKLALNDKLTIHVDGLDESITGTLRWISSEPAFTPYYALNQDERARLMYLAEVILPISHANLPSGVPVQVEMP